jgi:hypothetical protein
MASTATSKQPMMIDRPVLKSTLVTVASGQSFATSLIPTSVGNATQIIDVNTAGTDNSISGAYIDEIWFQYSQFSNNYFAPVPGLAGTYSQSGTTVTVTYSNHNLQVGQKVYLDYTTGTGVDEIITVTAVTSSTFVGTSASTLTTSGNVNFYPPTDFCFYLVNTNSITSTTQFLPLFTASIPSISTNTTYSLTLNTILPLVNQPVVHAGTNFTSTNSTVSPKTRGLLIGNGSSLYVAVGGTTALTNGFFVNLQGGYY